MIQTKVEFEEKVRRYSEIHAIVDKYSKELENIKNEIKPYMHENKLKKIAQDGKELELIAQDRSKVDSDKLLAVLKKRIEQFQLNVYRVSREFDNAVVNSLFYKDGQDVVRVELNGEVFDNLDDARQFLIDHYNFTEQHAQDAFSGAVEITEEEKEQIVQTLRNCIELKEVPNEDAVKEAVSSASLTMADISEATIVSITYALKLKSPKSKATPK